MCSGGKQTQSSLSVNKSHCARMTMTRRQREQQLQVNSFNTVHILVTSLNTSDNIVWLTMLYSRHDPNTVQVL